jgi:hypothetical protein
MLAVSVMNAAFPFLLFPAAIDYTSNQFRFRDYFCSVFLRALRRSRGGLNFLRMNSWISLLGQTVSPESAFQDHTIASAAHVDN